MKKIKYFLLVFFLMAISVSILPNKAFSQLVDPPPDPETDPDAPIDGGVSLLVAAGVGYGIKKARDQRKKNKTAVLQNV